jgi:hypothetical protein
MHLSEAEGVLMSAEWFVQLEGGQQGPLAAAGLQQLAAAGRITAATPVRRGADGPWLVAAQVQGLFPLTAAEDDAKLPADVAPFIHKPTGMDRAFCSRCGGRALARPGEERPLCPACLLIARKEDQQRRGQQQRRHAQDERIRAYRGELVQMRLSFWERPFWAFVFSAPGAPSIMTTAVAAGILVGDVVATAGHRVGDAALWAIAAAATAMALWMMGRLSYVRAGARLKCPHCQRAFAGIGADTLVARFGEAAIKMHAHSSAGDELPATAASGARFDRLCKFCGHAWRERCATPSSKSGASSPSR